MLISSAEQPLSGTWKLATDPSNIGRQEQWYHSVHPDAQDAPVPGILQQVFPTYHGVVWYWRTFTAPSNPHADGRTLLTFGAVDYYAEVYVNGRCVGAHEGPETPFTLDITDAIRVNAENLLAVRVLNPTNDPIDGMTLLHTPHRYKKLLSEWHPGSWYNYGGIIEPVQLHLVPSLHVTDLHAQPDAATGTLIAAVTVCNDSTEKCECVVRLSIAPAAGGGLLEQVCESCTFPSGVSEHKLQLTLAEFRCWDIDDPYLYRVTVELLVEGTPIHESSTRCGFRDFRVEKGFFRLNGRRIFLKSSHTANYFPIGQIVPPTPDLMRRDFLLAKATGYNMVRFIAGGAHPEQLDFCDEIGLLVYEESYGSWMLWDSPDMPRRYDASMRELILRDRNHPSVVIWGMLNETWNGSVFQHACQALPMVRELDTSRLVLLNSGRFDMQPGIGSLSNPGSDQWQYEWGNEGPEFTEPVKWTTENPEPYYENLGDLHAYPAAPHTDETRQRIRTLGAKNRPVFFSEYGICSILNAIGELRDFETFGARDDLPDIQMLRSIMERYLADFERWGLGELYAFPEDLLIESQLRCMAHRRLGFDLIRSNPKICGFNLTGMLDQVITGEGFWTYWRRWKPQAAETLSDGWAPLRWCLFVNPSHVYRGRKFTVEAVLANEDVLPPGLYPACARILSPAGVAWEMKIDVEIPTPSEGEDGPLAIPVFKETISLYVPEGEYELAVSLLRGGAPANSKLTFHVSETCEPIQSAITVHVLGIEPPVREWLHAHGVATEEFYHARAGDTPTLLLVGNDKRLQDDADIWNRLTRAVRAGGVAVFLDPHAFTRVNNFAKVGRLTRTDPTAIVPRNCPVTNVPEEDKPIYSKEFFGPFRYEYTQLPEGEYTFELCMSESGHEEPGKRIFHVLANGEFVLRDVDIVAETGGRCRALVKTFQARTRDGRIDVEFRKGPIDGPSICRLRVFDEQGQCIAVDTPDTILREPNGWLPLEKGQHVNAQNDLYHAEYIARRHPALAGLPVGMMDWYYYGQLIPQSTFQDVPDSDDVAAVAVGTGLPLLGGYISGIVLASYPLEAGRFILNTLRILENLDKNPAADRLLVNLIEYAATMGRRSD